MCTIHYIRFHITMCISSISRRDRMRVRLSNRIRAILVIILLLVLPQAL